MYSSSRSKVNIIVSLLIISSACLAFIVSAQPGAHAAGAQISLSPNHSHPSASVKVSGKAFGVSETISITFDTTTVGTATTDSIGAFMVKITIPSSALPGTHSIQAIGNTSGISVSARFLIQTNWAQFGFDQQHTHFNSYENTLSSSNVLNLVLDWSATTGNRISSSPVVARGIVYVGSTDGNLYAFNAVTGAPIWIAHTKSDIVSSPTVVNGVVYVGSDDLSLYAFNAATGAILWTAPTGGVIYSSPTVVNGVVYVGSTASTLFAFNARTGAILWSASIGGNSGSSPAVANGVVYVGSSDYQLYAFNATTGAILWTATTGNQINSSPTISEWDSLRRLI